MMKGILIPALFQMMMLSGCHSGQKASGGQDLAASLVLNGNVLELSQEKNKELTDLILVFLQGSDDFYELLVTDNLISSLKKGNKYLEIRFSDTKTVVAEKFAEIRVSQILIPLSGRYATDDQLTFFSGIGDFSNTPLIRSSGLERVLELVGE